MRIWVTRTLPAAARTAARLRDLGLEPVIQPVLEVRPLPAVLDLDACEALAFTSGNAVAAFAALTDRRDRPAYAVGSATAEALREIGFDEVHSADGDLNALARLLVEAQLGRVLAPGPVQPSGDLAALATGVPVQMQPIYETVPVHPVAVPEGVEAVLIHSARAAEVVAEQVASLTVFAISEAAAAPVKTAKAHGVHIAPFPDEPSLLKLCADILSDERE